MKNYLLLLIAFLTLQVSGFAQKNQPERLNNYKYVIVPIRFEFQSKDNEYLLSSRLKHFLDQKGFNTVVSVEKYPTDLAFNRCLALTAELKSLSEGFLSMHTELKLVMKNCHNQVVFETKIGQSRVKNIGDAYKEALRDAFSSFDIVHYVYNGNKGETAENAQPTPEPVAAELSPIELALEHTFVLGDQQFKLKKIAVGYLLYTPQNDERIALLHQTESQSILYNSKTVNGTVKITDDGRKMTVEYFNADSGQLEKLIYKAE